MTKKEELTKEDVYVVVDTPKKAKKLKKVLDVFGEKIYKSTNKRLSNGVVSEEYPTIGFSRNQWAGNVYKSTPRRTKVSIKELRNILAKEQKLHDNKMKIKQQELKEELNRIKGLVQNLEGKIEDLELEKEDKFAELKEAHKNGAVIQYYSNLRTRWIDVPDNNPAWFDHLEYRIKPEEKPKVGDVCKFWMNNETEFVVGVLARFDLSTYGYSTPNKIWYKNAKKLTKEESIELLFGKDGNND